MSQLIQMTAADVHGTAEPNYDLGIWKESTKHWLNISKEQYTALSTSAEKKFKSQIDFVNETSKVRKW